MPSCPIIAKMVAPFPTCSTGTCATFSPDGCPMVAQRAKKSPKLSAPANPHGYWINDKERAKSLILLGFSPSLWYAIFQQRRLSSSHAQRLEMRCPERGREFESPPLRYYTISHLFTQMGNANSIPQATESSAATQAEERHDFLNIQVAQMSVFSKSSYSFCWLRT